MKIEKGQIRQNRIGTLGKVEVKWINNYIQVHQLPVYRLNVWDKPWLEIRGLHITSQLTEYYECILEAITVMDELKQRVGKPLDVEDDFFKLGFGHTDTKAYAALTDANV